LTRALLRTQQTRSAVQRMRVGLGHFHSSKTGKETGFTSGVGSCRTTNREQAMPSAPRFTKAQTQAYVEQHDLQVHLQSVLQEVCNTQPASPLRALADLLQAKGGKKNKMGRILALIASNAPDKADVIRMVKGDVIEFDSVTATAFSLSKAIKDAVKKAGGKYVAIAVATHGDDASKAGFARKILAKLW